MADNTQTYTTRIFLNTEEAKKRLDELQAKVETLRKQKDEAARAGDWPTFNSLKKQLDQANNQMRSMQTSAQKIDRVLGSLSTAGIKDLQQTIKAINAELSSGSIERGSREWNFLTEQLVKCKRELREIRNESSLQEPTWRKVTGFFNRNWGVITQAVGTLSGLSFTIRKTVAAYSDMEQEMANVRKYTGQTAEEVERMNEDFKRMDTRTSREELNQLAGAAGRLGITETKLVEEFVDGADKIRVALGDDLGDGAVDTIGKLAIAFGEDKTKGLRGAMLATGSALNELVQNSPAQAQPIIEFTSKLSGVGQQAHLSQAQIMGFAAALDQNNQEMAASSTVMSQLITKMYQDPARFAKMAGIEVKAFADLVKNDMNQALVEWLQHVNSLGDMSVLASKFDELKMDGTRAVGVLATLAGHIDQVTEAQRIATQAYEEGNSVIEEFNVQNTTVQAQTEKAKKRFHDLAVELGEKLLPVVRYTISSGSMLVKMLSTLVDFVEKYRVTLASLTVTIVALNAKRLYGIALSKLEVLWNNRVASSIGGIGKAFKANPWAVAVTAVAAFVGILMDATRRLREHRKEVSAVEKAHKAAEGQFSEEASKVQMLNRIVHDSTLSYEKRKEKLDELKRIVPGYLADLDKEKGLINDNAEAIEEYLRQLERSIRMRAVEDELTEAYKRRRALGKQRETAEEESRAAGLSLSAAQYSVNVTANNMGTTGMAQLARGVDLATKNAQARVNAAKRALDDVDARIADNEKDIKDLENEIKKTDKGASSSTGQGSASAAEQEKSRAFWEEELKSRKEAYENTLKGSAAADDALKRVLEAERELAKYNSYKEPNKRTADEKKEENEHKRLLKERADAAKAEYQAEVAEEMMAYRQGISTYTSYMEKRHQITQNYYDEVARIYGKDSTEYKQLLDNREREEGEYYRWRAKRSEDELVRERLERERHLKLQYEDESSEIYHNQDALQEALFQSEVTYLRQRQKLYHDGSKEWEEIEAQIAERNSQHRFELEQDYIQRLAKYREEAEGKNFQQLLDIELKGVEAMYAELIASGRMTRDEYDAIVEHIRRKYAELEADQAADRTVQARASKSLDTARKMAGVLGNDAGNDAATGVFSVMTAVEQQKLVNERLMELYGEDYQNNREYQEAKRQLNVETMQGIVAGAQAAYSSISAMMSSVSALAQANSDLEVARITANYDKQIEAARNNTRKREKLELERDKKIAEAKTKANKKAMAMELAQAIAQTAMGAISAYSSTMAGAPYPANLILAPISAGIALAAGAMQIATIKKQHQAEAAGYYEGGFTGGRRYHEEAGVVHEGEFVANHQAVENPAVLPFLNFLDQAQRNNTVGSLTPQDVSRAVRGGGAAVVAPVVNVQTDNSELQDTLAEARDVLDRLTVQLEQGIGVDIPIDGENGLYRRIKRYENLINTK